MAAMSEKKYEEKYSWEGIKAGLEFSDMNGSPIDVEGLKFRFIYRDQYGRTCEVSQEADSRIRTEHFPQGNPYRRKALLPYRLRFRKRILGVWR